jgi:hypothetical protein
LARLRDPPVGGRCWIHTGRHHHKERIAECGIAWHRVLRATVVLLPK